MFGIRSSTRLAISIGIAGATIIWMAADAHIIPSPIRPHVENRIEFTKAISAHTAVAVKNRRLSEFQEVVRQIVAANDQLKSVGIVAKNGEYVVQSEQHENDWSSSEDWGMSKVDVEIRLNDQEWGRLQVMYEPIRGAEVSDMWFYPLRMVAFAFASITLLTWIVLSRTFKYLNPSKIVPTRVRSAFDSLIEGLLLVNKSGEIVHANQALGDIVGKSPEELVGSPIGALKWTRDDSNGADTPLPWQKCLATGDPVLGELLEHEVRGSLQKYIVNASPIHGANSELRGILVSFDDVTALEGKKTELANIINTLQRSRDEVERKNVELQFLASFDPLTKCQNRRSFWGCFEKYWNAGSSDRLNIMMVDIDHFKQVNDTHGHSIGDVVLKEMGGLLRSVVNERGLVCRYGGEEFTILIPNATFDEAVDVAWEINGRLREQQLGELDITASIGVSNGSQGAMDMQHMLDQADQCLYVAKRSGRNTVIRFDDCDTSELEVEDPSQLSASIQTIEYSAITGLLSALAFRCQDTAEHSLRVADLSVAIGQKMLSRRGLYRLETCALLHDIGKIGVPDEILNKPGPLRDSEWVVMRTHDEIGVEIVRSAFASDEVARIIECHHASYSANRKFHNRSPIQEQIPLESRIITVCDAFDAMISDRVYRPGMSVEIAIAELERCTPDQFDPMVVEKLKVHVQTREYLNKRSVVVKTSPHNAVVIGKHLESLCDAVANENVGELRNVVESLKQNSQIHDVQSVDEATDRLEDAMKSRTTEFDQVLDIANEVMDLCRSTRTSLVETASTVSLR